MQRPFCHTIQLNVFICYRAEAVVSFLVFKSSKWVVNCSKQSKKVLENQEFPGFDGVLPWQINSIFIIVLYLHRSIVFLLKCPILQVFSVFSCFCISGVSSQIFPYFLVLFPAILVNSLVNKCSAPTGLGFCYSKQLCLCVIKLHMGVNIQPLSVLGS